MNGTNRESDAAESDEAVMARVQAGDADALEILVRRHAGGLLGFLLRMTRDRGRAEDLFQETFLRVHTKAATFKTGQRFKAWLFAIAAHAAIDAQRRDARAPDLYSFDADEGDAPSLAEKIPAATQHPAEKLSADERRRRVRDAVENLPPRQRATVALAFFEGLTYPEVADALGCTVGTVKTQVSRAMQTLARLLPDAERSQKTAGGAR